MAKTPDSWHDHVLNTVLPRMEASATSLTPGPANQMPLDVGFQSLQPQHDLIEGLPPAAAEKLQLMQQRSADAHAVIPEFEAIREASAAKTEAANALKRNTEHPQDFGFNLGPDDPRVIAAQRHLENMTADAKRLTELRELRSAAWEAASQPKAAVESWLRDGKPHGTALEAVETEPPKLNKGESLLDAIERLRRDGRRVKADIHGVRSACYTKAEALAVVSAAVENWSGNGIDTSATIEHLSQPTIPTKTVQAMVLNVPGAPAAVVYVEIPDVIGIFSTVLKDQFIAWLAADVDRNADPKGALSHEARQQREAELMGDLLSTERDESAAVWAAQAQGLPVEHRGDISPLALLGVRLVTVSRATEAPGTTPGLSWLLRR